MASADYAEAWAIYPRGELRKGYCRRTAIMDVATAVTRLRSDLAAYVATESEAEQALAQARREGRLCRPTG